MCLHFLVHFDEGFGKTVLYQHKSKLGGPEPCPWGCVPAPERRLPGGAATMV